MVTIRVSPIRLLCMAGLLSLSLGATGQEEENRLTTDLQFMARGEIRNGGLPQTDDEGTSGDRSNFLLGRARLLIDYQRPNLETKMSIQHSGVWGDKGSNINVFEAWARLNAKNGLFVQAGRQALAYDDERIIGPNDWAMAALSHDALKFGYEGHGHKAHAILAYNQNAENMNSGSDYYSGGAQPYKSMQTGWYHFDFANVPLGASLLVMNIGLQAGDKGAGDERTEWQQIVGAYVKYNPGLWSAEASYYNQGGHDEDGIKIKAWMASVKATLKPSPAYGFEAGFDYLSGDEYFAVPKKGGIGLTRHDVIRGFNPIYGSHHQFYGAMDFFYVSTYVNGFTPGLQNAYVGGYVKPVKGLRLGFDYHYLAMATKLRDIDKTLGHEIELRASYQLMKDATISMAYSYMTGTETMERLKRASNDGSLRWGWISLNVSPRIFSTKW